MGNIYFFLSLIFFFSLEMEETNKRNHSPRFIYKNREVLQPTKYKMQSSRSLDTHIDGGAEKRT